MVCLRPVVRLLVACALLAAPTPAPAREPTPDSEPYVRSEQLYERGRMFLDFGEIERAIQSLRAAWRVYHDEKYLLALARAYDKKEDFENALRAYQDYLAFGVLAGERQAVVARVEEIRTKSSFGKELVEVTIDPPDAQVYLDEANPYLRVQAPGKVFVAWGEHKWIVQKDDYRERVVPFTVERDKPLAFALKLDRLEFYVNATLQSNPSGAEVSIDGRVVGKTPVTIRVREGYYTLRMVHDDLAPFEKLVEFTRVRDNVVQADLEKQRMDKGAVVADTAIAKDEPVVPPAGGDKGGPGPVAEVPAIEDSGSDEPPTIYRVAEPTKAWKITGWSLVGAGIAGVLAGGVFAGLAVKDGMDANSLVGAEQWTRSEHDKLHSIVSRANRNLFLAQVAAISGLSTVAAGTALLLVDRFLPQAAPVTVMPSVLPGGGGAMTLTIGL